MNETEGHVLRMLEYRGFNNFPKLLSIGVKNERPYLIQERLGHTLEYY